jgi:UDP-N-acetylglucosamine--N-acetylmuramyl-(pentapeptide) pyrophosphoryl-undecaprenol N-acetylglucosamine transferase
MTKHCVLLVAGGTGGHMFPAEAVATQLRASGVSVHLATDKRGMSFNKTFPTENTHVISSATFSHASYFDLFKALLKLLFGFFQSILILIRIRPSVVVGFGGYPSIPPLVAAICLGIPTALHEQNSVLGRANRFLGRFAKVIGTGFNHIEALPGSLKDKVVAVGNPVRSDVTLAAEVSWSLPASPQKIHIIVTGGSQGARILSEIVPQAHAMLPKNMRERIYVTHQARGGDIAHSKDIYDRVGIENSVQAFFSDLPRLIAHSHLVIGRAGASTVTELSVIGRPSLLIPLPGAIDQDQAANASILASRGAAVTIDQRYLSPTNLAAKLRFLIQNDYALGGMAKAAKESRSNKAAANLASLIMTIGDLADKRIPAA